MAELAVAEKIVARSQNVDSGSSGTSKKDIPSHGSYDDHIFSDRVTAQYWREVYEKAKYEGRHRFDPTYTWTAEEKKLVRKVNDSARQKPVSNTPQVGFAHYSMGVAYVLFA